MHDTIYTTFDSPLGTLLAVGDGRVLTRLDMQGGRRPHAISPAWAADDSAFADLRRQLDEYFAGARRTFDLELAPHGSPFEQRVWSALLEIPYGETTSYGALAQRIGAPGAARAVGLANGRNPIGIIVPCHRVVGSTGDLTGYGGGLDRKRRLLAFERGVSPSV
jgi:methylated-DNA-[protein]-cysteine S-methyltransferase